MNKKIIIIILISISIVCLGFGIILMMNNNNSKNSPKLKELPKPEITGGSRGELGIDKNINENSIDEYLNRSDSVYRDMRMLEDPAEYEKIGGDRFLSGYIKGFEVVPLPYILNVTGLPDVVGNTYDGDTLFRYENNQYIANYKESMSIIEELFPKDKVIFLMCGGGGYAGMTKNFLVSLGWNEDKIYNIGGYWYYRGKNNIEVKKKIDGKDTYDFDKVPYHEIVFENLTKSMNYKAPTVKVSELKMNTSQIELEEESTFKLNVIVLPNDATNKVVKWISSNEQIASVSNEGLVTAKKAGIVEIKVSTEDNKIESICKVTVSKKKVNYIKLDNIKEIADRYNKLNRDDLYAEFEKLTALETDSEGNFIQNEYHICDEIGCKANDKWHEEYEKYLEKEKEYDNERLSILNQLSDNKKSFILLNTTNNCDQKAFSPVLSTERILQNNNIPYLKTPLSNGSSDYYESKLRIENVYLPPVMIIKEGKVFAYVDENKDSINNEESMKRWLSKYIMIN